MNICVGCMSEALLLLAVANGVPVLARKLFGSHFVWPVDFGAYFFDKRRLLGYSKTWRGLILSTIVTAISAALLGFTMSFGALFGVLAMVGDLLSSFTKRRLGYLESSRYRVIDVIPESLIPVLALRESFGLAIAEGVLVVLLFFVLEVFLSPLLYRLQIRRRPY